MRPRDFKSLTIESTISSCDVTSGLQSILISLFIKPIYKEVKIPYIGEVTRPDCTFTGGPPIFYSMDNDKHDREIQQRKTGNDFINDGDVLPAIWLRRPVQGYSGLDAFLLDYGCSFLLPFGSIFYVLLLFL